MTDEPAAGARTPTHSPGRSKRYLINRIFLTLVAIALVAGGVGLTIRYRSFANAMNKEGCAANLRWVGNALLMYADEHGGIYPPDLATMAANEDITGIPFFCVSDCPQELRDTNGPALYDALRRGQSAFTYIGAGLRADAGETVVIAYETASRNHDGLGVLFTDGRVENVTAEELKVLLANSPPGLSSATQLNR